MTADQTEKLKALALAADQGEGQHVYTHPRDANNWRNNANWHHAANPAAVLELCNENTELRAEVERLKADRLTFRTSYEAASNRCVELEADNERLRAEAKRYRWLRDKSEPGICAFYLSVGQAFKGVKFAPETVDAALDDAIEKEKA